MPARERARKKVEFVLTDEISTEKAFYEYHNPSTPRDSEANVHHNLKKILS
jgi:ABC-type Fe3+ transport system substrate-binding protein